MAVDDDARTDELYGPGASNTFLSGAVFALTIDNGTAEYEAQAVVRRAFLPFTQCQVLLVDISGVPSSVSAPNPVVLKIFDPRFAKDREATSGRPDMPWSLAVEVAAAERRARHPNSPSPAGEDFERDPLAFEDAMLYACQYQFDIERSSYERLRPLQGGGIPRCFGAGSLRALVASPDPTSTPRPISPPFILLEYLESDSIRTVDPSRVPRPVTRALLEAVKAFESLGVCHTDLHPGNILFSPPNGALVSRAVIIDFGQATLRGDSDSCSDEEWREVVEYNWDFKRVCRQLHRAGIRYEDPRPEDIDWTHPRGAVFWNSWAEQHNRWVDAVEPIWVSPEGVQFEEPIRWRLKPEITRWLEDSSNSKIGIDPPRPGYPEFAGGGAAPERTGNEFIIVTGSSSKHQPNPH